MKRLLLICLLCLIQGIKSNAQDRDLDGLLDEWETRGFGPINPLVHRVNPNKADLFIWAAFRSATTTREMVEPEFEKVKRFFSRLPNRNPDGSTGINVIVLYGSALPARLASAEYNASGVYEASVPVEWRNYAHGYLIEPSRDGGGQSGARFAASGYNWATIVHEIGHQLGLGHEPPGGVTSPFYTSLMNYDYAYSFNGSEDNIHFSNGVFSGLHINETNLNETTNLTMSELEFLTRTPYNFRLQSITPTRTAIDWNRNGIFGETGVVADINDGYAVKIGTASHLNTTSGSPVLTSVGKSLFLIYPKLQGTSSTTWTTAKSALPSDTRGYHLYYQMKSRDASIADETLLLSSLAACDPAAIDYGNRLVVGFVIRSKNPILTTWKVSSEGLLTERKFAYDFTQTADQVALAVSGPYNQDATFRDSLWMFTWSATTNKVKVVQVKDTVVGGSAQYKLTTPINLMDAVGELESQSPIGVTYDRFTSKLYLVTTGSYLGIANRICLYTLKYVRGTWVVLNKEWVGGNNITTNTRPTVFVNDLFSYRREGDLCIFVKGNVPENNNSQIFRLLKVKDDMYPGGWRVKMIRDDWTTTRAAPAVSKHYSDLYFALRWCCEEHVLSNKIVLFNKASGIDNVEFMDFDDITHIATIGLRNYIIR